jgi:ABC-type antimicrobial peptide transport system permease subunit
MALGARRESIGLLVVAQVTRLAAAGTACGLLIAVVVMRYASSLFFQVSALDAVTYLTAAALISLVAIAAGYFPARRAARLDPVTVMNFE